MSATCNSPFLALGIGFFTPTSIPTCRPVVSTKSLGEEKEYGAMVQVCRGGGGTAFSVSE